MECIPCKFESRFTTNYRKHLASNKHKTVCSEAMVCHKCLRGIRNRGAYVKHVESCNVDKCPISYRLLPRDNEDDDNLDTLYMTFDELMRDRLTTSNQKIILSQMQREKSDIEDYIIIIDQMIEEDIARFDQEQEEDLADGSISKRKPYQLRLSKYFIFVLNALCRSTEKVVITHRNITINGSNREMLFKHKGALHTDVIIRQIAQRSKYSEAINDRNENFPKFSKVYAELFETLESHAMTFKNNHNNAERRRRMRRLV